MLLLTGNSPVFQSRESGDLNDWVCEKLRQKAESGVFFFFLIRSLVGSSMQSLSSIQSPCRMGAHSDAVLYKCDVLESSYLVPLQLLGACVSDTRCT